MRHAQQGFTPGDQEALGANEIMTPTVSPEPQRTSRQVRISFMNGGDTREKEKAEFVEFEIVQGSAQTVGTGSHWRVVRFVLMGLIGLALAIVLVTMGVILLIPLLIFSAIASAISSLFSTRPGR